MAFVELDGSAGEGGGQVVRSALALSLVTGTPFRIVNVRAGRARPGLLRQHLTAVKAAAEVGQARVEGAELGSRELAFAPGRVKAGDYRFSVGTAGSATLVFQAIFPALALARGRSTVVEGGTHAPMAPPFDFLARSYLPLVARMGPRVEVRLERAGFYPAGGGRLCVEVEPAEAFGRLDLLTRGPEVSRRATAILSLLDRAIGERGVSAETVGAQAARGALDWLAADVPVGAHLADQLLLPMALGGGGAFRTTAPTLHTRTHAEVIQAFLGTEVDFEDGGARGWTVMVPPR